MKGEEIKNEGYFFGKVGGKLEKLKKLSKRGSDVHLLYIKRGKKNQPQNKNNCDFSDIFGLILLPLSSIIWIKQNRIHITGIKTGYIRAKNS